MSRKSQSETLYLLTYEEIEQFEALIYKLQESYWEIMDRRRVAIPPFDGEVRMGPATRSFHEAYSDIARKKERYNDEFEAHLENVKKNKISDHEIEF